MLELICEGKDINSFLFYATFVGRSDNERNNTLDVSFGYSFSSTILVLLNKDSRRKFV